MGSEMGPRSSPGATSYRLLIVTTFMYFVFYKITFQSTKYQRQSKDFFKQHRLHSAPGDPEITLRTYCPSIVCSWSSAGPIPRSTTFHSRLEMAQMGQTHSPYSIHANITGHPTPLSRFVYSSIKPTLHSSVQMANKRLEVFVGRLSDREYLRNGSTNRTSDKKLDQGQL